ncbi:TlpA family protein disulfide reductase [Pseudooceanicola sp.]|uniref:TlpA family protein disulfide reductase n=1 Tax=Pseudooceanicola sp. TaxID=1914328 RepID=UPI0035C6BB6F
MSDSTATLLTWPWALGLGGLILLVLIGEVLARRDRRHGRGLPPGVSSVALVLVWGIAARVAALRGNGLAAMAGPLEAGLSPLWGLAAAMAVGLGWALRRSQLVRPLAVVALVGVATGVPALLKPPAGDGRTLEGAVLPALGGAEVDLAQRDGRALVLNLWASWCGPCRSEMPMMQQVAAQRPDVEILFANQAEDSRTIALFLALEGLSGEAVLIDAERRLARRYGSAALPSTFFFRSDGQLAGAHIGELSEAQLLEWIAKLTGEQP